MSKRRIHEDDLSSESDDSDSMSDGEELFAPAETGETVNFELVFGEPRDHHYHALRAILKHCPSILTDDQSGLVNAIVSQAELGTLIKGGDADAGDDDDEDANMKDDGEDVFGLITLLPTAKYAGEQFMKDYRSRLQTATGFSDEKWAKSAIMVDERLLNVPQQVAPVILQFLAEEIQDASEEIGEPWKSVESILYPTRIMFPENAAGTNSSNKRSKQSEQSLLDGVTYYKAEDEYLATLACTDVVSLGEDRIAMVIERKQLWTVVKALQTNVFAPTGL